MTPSLNVGEEGADYAGVAVSNLGYALSSKGELPKVHLRVKLPIGRHSAPSSLVHDSRIDSN
jgi:hypothetical protein